MSRLSGAVPVGHRAASVAPSSLNAEKRTIELVWSTGAAVRRYDWWTGRYYDEVLSLEPAHVDLSRMESGAPLLDAHDMWRNESVVGVVERAWLKGGEGRAVVRFAQGDEKADAIWRKVVDGIIRNVSVGYSVEKYEITKEEGKRDVYKAVRWTPLEVSMVPVGADADAGVRAEGGAPKGPPENVRTFECEFVNRAEAQGAPMSTPSPAPSPAPSQIRTDPPASPAPAPVDVEAIKRAAAEAERTRALTIRTRVAGVNLPVSVADDLIARGVDLAHVGDAIVDEMARRGTQNPPRPTIEPGQDHTDPAAVRARMADAIAAQATRYQPAAARIAMPDNAREFSGRTILDLMSELARAHGHKVERNLPPALLYERMVEIRALSTSDFPLLLADAGNKILVKAYELAAPTYRLVFARKSFRDFKPHKFLRAGDFPVPLQVGESGEFQFGAMSEAKNEITMATYGRIMGINRRMIVNDDTGAFAELPLKVGRRVADFENATAWAQLSLNSGAGPTIFEKNMPSGRPLFHTADHGNLASSGTTIDVTNVGIGRAAMMKQTSLDGLKMNVEPRYLVTGPDRYTLAEQFCAVNIVATQDSNANPFKGRLTPVGDANLSGNAWYLFGDPGAGETLVYGFLEGLEGPRLASREGFTTEGIDLRVSLDFVAGAYDFRFAYKNPGA